MTTPHKALLIQARDWIAGKGEIVFAGCGMAAVDKMNALHATLQAAIDAPEPEPVAWMESTEYDEWFLAYSRNPKAKQLPLYLHPPAVREPLTKAEIDALWDGVLDDRDRIYEIRIAFTRAIEAAHGIGVKP